MCEAKDALVEIQDIPDDCVAAFVEQQLAEGSGAEDRRAKLPPGEVGLLVRQRAVVDTALHATLGVHHPDGDVSAGGENQVDLDRRVPDILGVHPIWALQEVETALMTVAVEEDRDAREGGPVLPSGQTGTASE